MYSLNFPGKSKKFFFVSAVFIAVLIGLIGVSSAFAAEPASATSTSCWSIDNETTCGATTGCMWYSDSGTTGAWCEQRGCWDYWTSETCGSASGCSWNEAGYCQEVDCDSYSDSSTCQTNGCTWEAYGWCEEAGCWNYYNDEAGCTNESDDLNCEYNSPYCVELGPWDYQTQEACEAASYTWSSESWCEKESCWNYETQEACLADANGYNAIEWGNCSWDAVANHCYLTECGDISDSSECSSQTRCQWRSEMEFCETIPAGDFDATNCTTAGYTWSAEQGLCYENAPWIYESQESCENDGGFTWISNSGMCMEAGCWDYGEPVACELGGCTWNSDYNFCEETPLECDSQNAETACGQMSGCTWRSQGGACSETGCWDYDYNQTGCEAASGCEWQDPFCEEKECWNYATSETCSANSASGCYWNEPSESGWCEQVDCWAFDGDEAACEDSSNSIGKACVYHTDPMSGDSFCDPLDCFLYDSDQAGCENESDTLDCTYDTGSGECEPVGGGCGQHDGDQDACFDTQWCFWNASAQTCREPAEQMDMENPGCWLFDYDQSTCTSTAGCAWNVIDSSCDPAPEADSSFRIQCGNITNKTICNSIPALGTCCTWENGVCEEAPYTQSCWDNMQPPPTGAMFCDDYNAVSSQETCLRIAGSPWYMPCKWSNTTSRCEFRFTDMFGGEAADFEDISTKKNCEAAGGIWKSETWSENGDVFVDNWCEMGTGMGYDSCDDTCWACEYKSDGTNWNNTGDAQSACEGSSLGFCQFRADNNAPNGFGWCEPKQDMQFGGLSCSQECPNCFTKSKCEGSSAGCRWMTDPNDPTIGWCDSEKSRSCSEDCWECYDESSCVNNGLGGGKCSWDSTNYYCKPKNFDKEVCFDGKDNDNNGQIDCADPYCMSDPFCGGDLMSDCGKYRDETECGTDHDGDGVVECVWISDSMTGEAWCGQPGENCWMYKANETGCDGTTGCNWRSSDKGFCDINETRANKCFGVENRLSCGSMSECTWMDDPFSPNGGFCDFKLFSCFELNETTCGTGQYTYCKWRDDPYMPNGGECQPICFSDQYNPGTGDNTTCLANANCDWIHGMCEPEGGMMMDECFQYDGDETGCESALGCSWHSEGEGMCDVNMSGGSMCWDYQTSDGCEAADGCSWIEDDFGMAFCENEKMACFVHDGDQAGCEAAGCTWVADMELCESDCFLIEDSETCNTNPSCIWSTGFCDPKMVGDMFEGMESGAPVMLGIDGPDASLSNELYVDIMGMGLKDMKKSYGFGIGIADMAEAMVCNGESVMSMMTQSMTTGSGTKTTKFYLYLDSDENTTNGCTSDDGNETGFEFAFEYKAENDNGLKESKVSYKCVDGNWAPTPIKVTNWKKAMCQDIGGGMLAVDKGDLKKFPSLFVIGSDLRVYATSAGGSDSKYSPADSVGPVYYTPGTMDFKIEDCMAIGQDLDGDGFTAENDPDCMDFKRFGYVPFEDCFNSVDDDGDGNVDCDDSDCEMLPVCGGSLDWSASGEDVSAPRVIYKQVDRFNDSAFITFDTNEPANGSVVFYGEGSACSAINMTLNDTGDPASTKDDYKPWHGVPLDNWSGNPQRLGYSLRNGTTYSYKLKVCDPSGNCATSACMNFTTRGSATRDFVFGMDLDDDYTADVPNWDVENDNFENGKKISPTQGKGVNLSVNCPTAGYTITLVGLELRQANNFNMSNVFVCNASNNLLGMGSDTWQKLVKLNVQYILVEFATTGNTIQHCNNDGTSCTNVTDILDCTFGDNSTTCKVPVSLGFSTYKLTGTTTEEDDTDDTEDTTSGTTGGSSSGSVAPITTTSAIVSQTWDQILAATPGTLTTSKDVILYELSVDVAENLQGPSVTISKPESKPAVTDTPPGKVFGYITIDATGFTEDNVDAAVIYFKVYSSWIEDNNIDKDKVYLYRWTDQWDKLDTQFDSESNDFAFYRATTPGFSHFVVSGEPIEESTTPAEETAEPGTAETTETTEPAVEPATWDNILLVVGVALAIVVAFAIVVGMARRGR